MGDGGAGPVAYRAQADMLILGQDMLATTAATAAAQAVGCRPVGPLDHAEAIARIEAGGETRHLILAIGADEGRALDMLLAAIDRAARQGRCHGMVTLPVAMIDRVAAAITHAAIELLCEPTPLELATAIALRAAQTGLPGDASGQSEGLRRIAEAFAASADEPRSGRTVREHARGYHAGPAEARGDAMTAGDFRRVIRARRLRARFFGDDLFADPAWDMLLDLAAARLEGGAVAVSSLCIASAVPPTTALRWIRIMTEQGLLVRTADPMDGRRVFIGLSDAVAGSMNAYFTAVKDAGLLA
ncbi:winged helix DNA-binding protein [Sphingomonas colocasiae]|uniref:Winged helix DNA-binding protein n=1 Tax=Sphingomonas colocasiae TaxID=1848973 RepID=A0ABS7PK32_9SPHN|nr:winged helix DNA-binding protein [Sphingomonas colocasiae]MBY8821648.1 winged helix DNA-binding protein [Sphingomonas colocasiae]